MASYRPFPPPPPPQSTFATPVSQNPNIQTPQVQSQGSQYTQNWSYGGGVDTYGGNAYRNQNPRPSPVASINLCWE